jgi:hypothetical protein
MRTSTTPKKLLVQSSSLQKLRPQTAKPLMQTNNQMSVVGPRVKMTPTMSTKQKLPTTRKKIDPVSRFHNMQTEWSKNTFLKNKG